jgi:hypothetical protein
MYSEIERDHEDLFSHEIKVLFLDFPLGAAHPSAGTPVIRLGLSLTKAQRVTAHTFCSSNLPEVELEIYGKCVGILVSERSEVMERSHFFVLDWMVGYLVLVRLSCSFSYFFWPSELAWHNSIAFQRTQSTSSYSCPKTSSP